jgi:class 3 adenylate cyclase
MRKSLPLLLAWLRADAGFDESDWRDRVERDAVAATVVISASAGAAFALHILPHAREPGLRAEYLPGKLIILALATTALVWLPGLMRRTRSPAPAAAFWGLATLASAALDKHSHLALIIVVWSLVPGYLVIGVLGSFLRMWLQMAALAAYCAASTWLLRDYPRALELQFGLFGMVVSMGGYVAHLYRRSVRAERTMHQVLQERMRHLGRLLPEPIADALANDTDLRALLQPHRREVVVVAIDVRGSTALLQRIGADAYLATVQPMVTRLYRHARQLAAFAKFQGDGLLIVFGAFDDQLSPADRMATVAGFLHTASGAVRALNRDHAHNLVKPLRVGMGVAIGSAVVGSVADTVQDVLFDVVGEPVAYACRLEALSKTLSGVDRNVVVMGESVARHLRMSWPLEPVHASHVVRDFEEREALWLLDLRQVSAAPSQGASVLVALVGMDLPFRGLDPDQARA